MDLVLNNTESNNLLDHGYGVAPNQEVESIINNDLKTLTPIEEDSVRPSVVDKHDQLYSKLDILNNLEELRRLERRSIVVETMRSRHVLLNGMDTTFARRISGIIIRNDDCESAWKLFKLLNASTPSQKEILVKLNQQEFVDIWKRCKYILALKEDSIFSEVYKRTHLAPNGKKKGQSLWNDFYEINQHPRRSLEQIRKSGVDIELSVDSIEQLRNARKEIEQNGTCPILEQIKNEKVFKISGLGGSKASLTIHDLFDHFWTYDLLDKKGVFDRYKDFFDRVGNPQNTDMFKREAELIASAVFGTRLFQIAEKDFAPIVSWNSIINLLKKSSKTENFTLNQKRALEILDQTNSSSFEAGSLSYVVSNMAIELMEQRRKHGFIKNLETQSDGTLYPVGVMNVLDPEYVALIVEINHMILDPSNKAEQSLLNISVIVEDYLNYLSGTASNDTIMPLNVKVEYINSYDINQSSLNKGRIDWLQNNAGFASTKASLC